MQTIILIVFILFGITSCRLFSNGRVGRPSFKKVETVATNNSHIETSGSTGSGAESCSVNLFLQNVEPVIDQTCMSCHGSGGPGASFLSLNLGKTANAVAANASELLQRSDLIHTDRSLVLKKISGETTHGANTNPVVAKSSKDFSNIKAWIDAEAICQANNSLSTNLTRSSGSVMQQRLSALFPKAAERTPGGDYTGLLTPSRYDVFDAVLLDKTVAAIDRNYTPPAMIAVRQMASSLCTSTAVPTTMFDASDILLPGENLPEGEDAQLALAAVRRSWLYPYDVKSPEVQATLNLYQKAKTETNGNTASAKQTVCIAMLTAPQFFLGNAGADDVVRRVSLEIASQIPSWQDFAEFRAATDKAQFIRQYAERLQTSDSTRDSYISTVSNWHREWLGLRDFILDRNTMDRNPLQAVDSVTATAAEEEVVDPSISGFANQLTVRIGLGGRQQPMMDYSESCQKGLAQNFDPETTKVVYQHKNPLLAGQADEWETIGSVEKINGIWVQQPGAITILIGSPKMVTSLADIANTVGNNGLFYYQPFVEGGVQYNKSKLAGTPVDGFRPEARRILRYSPSGLQNGYSEMRLWYTGEKVRVCNDYSRFVFTCTHRSFTRQVSDRRNYQVRRLWNAASTKLEVGADFVIRDSFARPEVLENFRCGVPDLTMIAQEGQPGYNENAAYPKGNPGEYNDLAIYGAKVLPNKFNLNPDVYFDKLSSSSEVRAVGRLFRDLRREPYRLIEHILKENMDYRQLLTADFTYGGKELELLFRTQGFYTPGYPVGYQAPFDQGVYNEAKASEEQRIVTSEFESMPLSFVKSRYGCYALGVRTYCPANLGMEPSNTDYIIQNKIPPRELSGILTQGAFINPIGYKARTLSARIFTRLMCGSPNDFLGQISEEDQDFSTQFVPTKENNTVSHLDKTKGCYSCHVVMDPVAAVLNSKFLRTDYSYGDWRTGTSTPMYGEIMPTNFYGIRGGGLPAKGAFLGKSITGIRELGQAVANSDGFLRCTVKTSFKNVFGREPDPRDAEFIDKLTQRFKTDLKYNYNRLIQELVASPSFMGEN